MYVSISRNQCKMNKKATARILNCHLLQTMSPKEKTKFDDLAKTDKVRYDQEMMHYNPGKKGQKQKKDPNAPRRPAYVFCSLFHPELLKMSSRNIVLCGCYIIVSLLFQVWIFPVLFRAEAWYQGSVPQPGHWRCSQETWRDVEQSV